MAGTLSRTCAHVARQATAAGLGGLAVAVLVGVMAFAISTNPADRPDDATERHPAAGGATTATRAITDDAVLQTSVTRPAEVRTLSAARSLEVASTVTSTVVEFIAREVLAGPTQSRHTQDAPSPDVPQPDASQPDASQPDAPTRDRAGTEAGPPVPAAVAGASVIPQRDGPQRDGPQRDGPQRDGPQQDAPRQDALQQGTALQGASDGTVTAAVAASGAAAAPVLDVPPGSAPALGAGDRVEATLSFYYCERGAQGLHPGDGGTFCGAMRNGDVVYPGAAACDYAYLGQRFRIQGDPLGREYVCADTGSAVHGLHRDIWFMDSDQGWAWQRIVGQRAVIEVLE